MNIRTRLAIAALTFLTSINLCVAQEWTTFRGPSSGISSSKRLPVSWGPEDNVRWQSPLAGKGWSSPVLSKGKLYLTSAVPEGSGHTLHAICLDAASGKEIWNTKVFTVRKTGRVHNKNSYASPTPIVTKDRLYVHFGHQGSACLNLGGKVIWRNQKLKYRPVHGNGGSQILVNNKLIFSIDGAATTKVVALNATDGTPAWSTDRKSTASRKFSFTTPLHIVVDGQSQVISPASNMVCAYDPENGREIWRVTYDGYSVIPKPVYGNGLVYICTGYNTPSLLAIRPNGKGDVTQTHVKWVKTKKVPHTPSLLLIENRLYMVSDRGIASCLDAISGDVIWEERVGKGFSASPLYANGLIYFQDEKGNTTVVKAEDQFQIVSKNRINDATLASYAVGAAEIYLRTEKALYRLQNGN